MNGLTVVFLFLSFAIRVYVLQLFTVFWLFVLFCEVTTSALNL